MSSEACSRPMKGWLRGSFAATAAIELFFLAAMAESVHRVSTGGALAAAVWMVAFAPLVWLVTCALSAIPSFLIVRLSERFRIQSVLFFGCTGAAIGAFSPVLLFRSFANLDLQSLINLGRMFVAPGCLAGLTYWYVAGRYAGEDDLP